MEPIMIAKNIDKTFVLHNQGAARLPVLRRQNVEIFAGECLVLNGSSGSGKSSLLRSLYGNYQVDRGELLIRQGEQWLDMAEAEPRQIIALRRNTIGWVSQFLRVIPRLSALDIVMQPMLENGISEQVAKPKAQALLHQLNVPERLWGLAPATFSGGEQQRVNIARGFALDYPILLLDEPTASLDKHNAQQVVELILAAKQRGAAIVGIFHDVWVRELVADRLHNMQEPSQLAG
ncbi:MULTISPECIES: phosphonate C-P lyase system protein PhnL [unclassified Agarivorans]|uniref:phosphonate C-P lyase system protein PhnL n=1 Tax=unclassified Agarivorans TaxID=2636026 RepID=UPI0026E3B6A5|nr:MULTISPECIES: phosphonate C-P lyase system protein PhnL [unclassified Agarivorans]MDO6688070.1 phosphonate C-P lyase system protein PhnL [Agarivorans sp. 3_MG-2023]MDO6717665.1 phosphonate C-P lyase system protein PhnL [Agarivorans sp. 2_MG-2023]